jgi:DNA-binding transcriptional LysR family regulator
MIRDLDLSLLRAFAAVVETGSVTGAARMLNRTQAAVSQQIKRLEETLGQPLFEREHKRLTLAPSGERLLGPARRLVAANDEIFERMSAPVIEMEVRLGVPVDLIATYVPPILRRFNATWPGVRVTLVAKNSFDLLKSFDAGEVDLTITTDLDSPARAECLGVDELVWVGAAGGSAHRRTPLPVAIGSKTSRFRVPTIDALRSAGRDWRLVLEVSNQDAVNATMAAGVAVGTLLRTTIPAPLEELSSQAGLPPLPSFAYNLYLPRSGGNESARELARHIRAEFSVRGGR